MTADVPRLNRQLACDVGINPMSDLTASTAVAGHFLSAQIQLVPDAGSDVDDRKSCSPPATSDVP